jgi:hypothetical protein
MKGLGWLNELGTHVVGLPNNSYKSIANTAWVRARLCKLQKECIRLAAASDKAYQLLANGRWFSPGIPASSSTKSGRHDIAKILLKVALNTINKSINQSIILNESVSLVSVCLVSIKPSFYYSECGSDLWGPKICTNMNSMMPDQCIS